MRGFQVAPAEVEAVLYRHPAVLDCAVFGVPDARAGEVPVAAVKLGRTKPLADGELERLVADSTGHVQAAPPRGHRRRDPTPPVRQSVAAHLARRIRPTGRPQRAGRRIDGRPASQEQQALREPRPRSSTGSVEIRRRDRRSPAGREARCGRDRVRTARPPGCSRGRRSSGVGSGGGHRRRGARRGAADASFLGPTLAAELRRLAGAPPGDTVETVALDSAPVSLVRGVDRTCPPAVAIDAQGSDRALLLAHGPEGGRLAQVDLHAQQSGLDLTRPSVVVDGVAVAAVEGAQRTLTQDDLARWTALGLSVTCADLVGTMRGAVDLACTYATHRHQYGAAIGSFQAVQHMLADAFVAMEGSRSVTLHAAWAVDACPRWPGGGRRRRGQGVLRPRRS